MKRNLAIICAVVIVFMIINISYILYFFNRRNIILGYSPSGIPFYKNNKKEQIDNWVTMDNKKIYCGIKWQCVEFARRYLIVTHGITFSDVTSAFQIPDAKFTTLDGKQNIEVRNNLQVGSLIVWPKNYMANSVDGHVAVVSSITPNGITVVEQNYDNKNEINRFIRRDDMRNTTILTVELN